MRIFSFDSIVWDRTNFTIKHIFRIKTIIDIKLTLAIDRNFDTSKSRSSFHMLLKIKLHFLVEFLNNIFFNFLRFFIKINSVVSEGEK